MFNRVASTSNTPSISDEEKPLQEMIDTIFNAINPLQIDKDSGIEQPLSQLTDLLNGRLGLKYAAALKDKLLHTYSEGIKFIDNDIGIIINVIDDISGPGNFSLKDSVKEQTLKAIQTCLPSFSYDDFSISDERDKNRESINFNRLLPTVGMASQNYGYLGKKLLLEGTKQILQGSKQDERYEKFKTVIFNTEPNNDSVESTLIDYYMDYNLRFGDQLDEPLDENRP
ncbi:hypothetical protein [Brenneria rubrifaciens]|uniref:Uncharacterized protein n=1 Tax=Brenneria rubrifaciens TaxID=55213 RepID=A0A4P8QMD0_9GAMM|nr:hypothetical protein [Brenneria rubrifaciens]QCR08101.1 hypothetical protein EH207_05945 [Brenneria rubrifaciens]